MDRKDYRKIKSNNYSGPDKKAKSVTKGGGAKGGDKGGKASISKHKSSGDRSKSSSSSSGGGGKPYKSSSSGSSSGSGSSSSSNNKKDGPGFSLMDKLKASVKSKLNTGGGGGGRGSGSKKEGHKKHEGSGGYISGNKRSREDSGKDLRTNRKAKTSHFDLIEQLKMDWNKIRIKTTTEEVRKELVVSMMRKITGRVVAVSLRHDASRVVQSLFQYGTVADRLKLIDELSPKVAELAKTPYGHFVLLKAINCCNTSPEQIKIAKSLQGHFVALGSNVIGARVVETLLVKFNARVTKRLRTEFYGNKFILAIGDSVSNLDQLVKAAPAKESAITDHMRDLVQKFCDKGLLSFNYVHDIVWEYVCLIKENSKRMTDVIELLVDHLPNLMESKHGSKTACLLAAHSTAKDRKRMVKSLKGLVSASLVSSSAHLYIMRLVEVVDDTVMVQKSILDEIKSTDDVPAQYTATGEQIGHTYPKLVTIAMDKYGSKFLLRLLNPLRRHLEPDEEALFYADVPTSKKPAQMRRRELMAYLRAPLIFVCTKYCNELLRNRFGARVVSEVISCFRPPVLIQTAARLFCGLDIGQIDLSAYESAGGNDMVEDNDDEDDGEVETGAKGGGAAKKSSSKKNFDEDEDEEEEGDDEYGEDYEEGDEEGDFIPEDGYEEDEVQDDVEKMEGAPDVAAAEVDDLWSKTLSEIPFVVAAFKYLIAIDQWIEAGKSATSEIGSIASDALWSLNSTAESTQEMRVSFILVTFLKNPESLTSLDILTTSFLSNNKATGLLVDISNSSALKDDLMSLLSIASHRKLLEDSKPEENENAKVLLAKIPSMSSTPSSKQDKKTPSKSAKK